MCRVRPTGIAARGWVWTGYDAQTGLLFNYLGDAQNTFPVWGVKPGPARPMSLDDTITARHVFAVMPLSVSGDNPSLRDVAARVGDEIAAQMAARAGSSVLSRTKTAAFDAPSPALERLASELQATYAITGRVRPARQAQA